LIVCRDFDDDEDYSDGGGSSSSSSNIKFMVLTHCHIVICFENILAFLSATILNAAGFVFGKYAQYELYF
jgi:hypothetical protein